MCWTLLAPTLSSQKPGLTTAEFALSILKKGRLFLFRPLGRCGNVLAAERAGMFLNL